MAKKEIVWTQTAALQRRIILEYWNENNNSTSYSEKLIMLIKKRLLNLSNYPQSGKRSNFISTRVTSLGHYSIYYRIHKQQLVITGFWDNRQDPKKLHKLLTDNKRHYP